MRRALTLVLFLCVSMSFACKKKQVSTLMAASGEAMTATGGYGEWGFVDEYRAEFNIAKPADTPVALHLMAAEYDTTKPILTQGDMVVPYDTYDQQVSAGLALGVGEVTRAWPNSELVYTITDGFQWADSLQQAMTTWTQAAGVKFRVAGDGDTGVVQISSDQEGCFATVGYTGRSQMLNLGTGCGKVGTAIHELGHALGLHHEQSRSDRDQFVQINYDNITPENVFNFDIAGAPLGPYNYDSIMHYGEFYFSKNGDRTIQPLQDGAAIGNREKLTDGDINAMKQLYANAPTGNGTDSSTSTPDTSGNNVGNGNGNGNGNGSGGGGNGGVGGNGGGGNGGGGNGGGGNAGGGNGGGGNGGGGGGGSSNGNGGNNGTLSNIHHTTTQPSKTTPSPPPPPPVTGTKPPTPAPHPAPPLVTGGTPTAPTLGSADTRSWCTEGGGRNSVVSNLYACICGTNFYREDAMRKNGEAAFVAACKKN